MPRGAAKAQPRPSGRWKPGRDPRALAGARHTWGSPEHFSVEAPTSILCLQRPLLILVASRDGIRGLGPLPRLESTSFLYKMHPVCPAPKTPDPHLHRPRLCWAILLRPLWWHGRPTWGWQAARHHALVGQRRESRPLSPQRADDHWAWVTRLRWGLLTVLQGLRGNCHPESLPLQPPSLPTMVGVRVVFGLLGALGRWLADGTSSSSHPWCGPPGFCAPDILLPCRGCWGGGWRLGGGIRDVLEKNRVFPKYL